MTYPRRIIVEQQERSLSGPFLDIITVVLIACPILGTFFPPETYFGTWTPGGVEVLPYPITPVMLLIIAATVTIMYIRLRIRKPVRHLPLMYAFVAWVFICSSWSAQPGLAFNRTLRMLPMVALGVMFIQFYSMKKFLRLLTIAVLISALCSIVVSVAFPSLSTGFLANGYESAWRGALIHKNAAGLAYSLGAMIVFLGIRLKYVPLLLALPTLGACAFVIIMSQSLSPVIAATIAVIVVLSAQVMTRFPGELSVLLAVVVVMLIICATTILAGDPASIAAFAGRDVTLTGRTDIWAEVWPIIQRKPLLGHGYVFWASDSVERDLIWTTLKFEIPHAHNAWLDLWLQTGIIGLAIILAQTLYALFGSARLQIALKKPEASVYLAITVMFLIIDITETQYTDPAITGIFWLTFALSGIKQLSTQAVPASQGGPSLRRTFRPREVIPKPAS